MIDFLLFHLKLLEFLAATLAPDPALLETVRCPKGNPLSYDIFGQRYHVRPSSAGYHETGVASWYGPNFHGRPTSNGETYNMYGMTAAHTTLPLPTWVAVTNLANDRRVVVRVNDRGPFVNGRIIDLSYTAALALDMVQDGVVPVHVEALPSRGRGCV